MKMKYIVIDYDTPHIFDDAVTHFDVASALTYGKLNLVTSAGFCDYRPDKYGDMNWECWGRSISLRISSSETDARLFTQTFCGW